MEIKINNLQECVRYKFKSTKQLTRRLGWSYSKTYRIVSGHQKPNVDEVLALADVLDLKTLDEIRQVFGTGKN